MADKDKKSTPATKSDIDQLAEMLKGTTRVMKGKFDEVDEGFNRVYQRFDRVDEEIDNIKDSLHRIEHEILKDHARRIEALEEKIAS